MIRGLPGMKKSEAGATARLLEWTVLDGWEPLCEFLGKEVPDESFPHVNDAAGFKGREKQAMGLWFKQGFINIAKALLKLSFDWM